MSFEIKNLSDKEAVKAALDFIDADIQDVKGNLDSVCDNCLILKIFASYPKEHWQGIAIGLSASLGCLAENDSEGEANILHWLGHIVKLIENDK